ncbi:MAG: hypothetical protein JW709_00510, partial [Sedimentisphaerales bacterium]|nr:hypothetical protein [Sedimentisphaerales bacterium]
MRSRVFIGVLLFSLAGLSPLARADDFYAYYTKVNSGEPFEQYSRTGEYADIIVAFDGMAGKLVFWRGSSYLPYWETPSGTWYLEEIIPRSGDGDGIRPDKVNTYSHVCILENTPTKVLIRWRYLPQFSGTNPHTGVAREKFVEEYFEVESSGAVRRVIRNAADRVTDWRDPYNCTVQKLMLTTTGVTEVEKTTPKASLTTHVAAGSPVKTSSLGVTPVYCWHLDEGVGA